ncbi:transposase family protein [Sporolactobacillus sp. Y61]|uniref:Transposase family protein n=1 Tax=Sporolactobacillus sp. Y61 TaxID=3160863 RepID=A0AAU8IFJ8_9BACL
MITRKEKREQEKNVNYFLEFQKICHHFFKGFTNRLRKVKDPRHQSYVTYDSDLMLWMMILKNVCQFTSMRSLSNGLNREECIDNLQKMLATQELHELPHYDTINDFLSRLDPKELENIRIGLIRELLKKRCFEAERIEGKYWGIIIDGTGLFHFNKKHCAHCLKREHTHKKTGETWTDYQHHVLEAKLVVGDMVLSIDSEFIENEHEDVTKQDCERRAFERLSTRLKATFKRLPICILADSLYACESVFQRCEANRWKYMFRFKAGSIPSVAQEFEALKALKYRGQSATTYWVNDIAYQERKLNALEATVQEKEKAHTFLFLTNLPITEKKAEALVAVGRRRWKIENQGFNRQKHVQYAIQHVNSQNHQAMKIHYLLTQIADILMQLYEKGSKLLRTQKKTAKEISSALLEAIRTRRLTEEDMASLVKPMQVRFTG